MISIAFDTLREIRKLIILSSGALCKMPTDAGAIFGEEADSFFFSASYKTSLMSFICSMGSDGVLHFYVYEGTKIDGGMAPCIFVLHQGPLRTLDGFIRACGDIATYLLMSYYDEV